MSLELLDSSSQLNHGDYIVLYGYHNELRKKPYFYKKIKVFQKLFSNMLIDKFGYMKKSVLKPYLLGEEKIMPIQTF